MAVPGMVPELTVWFVLCTRKAQDEGLALPKISRQSESLFDKAGEAFLDLELLLVLLVLLH